MKKLSVNAAFVGFGEVNSPQELIRDKCLTARKEIESLGFNVITTDHVTDDPGGLDVRRAVKDLKKGDFDLLIVCLAGWIPSHAVIVNNTRIQEQTNDPMGTCRRHN